MKSLPRVAIVVAVAAAAALIFVLPRVLERAPKPAGSGTGGKAALSALLDEFKGRVLVLLLGRDGCPGTARATALLDVWEPPEPERTAVLRLDVPLPGERLKLKGAWKHKFPRRLDRGRAVAQALNFFFYPTLYVFDADGVLRFEGGMEPERLTAMVSEILAEAPGAPKRIYTVRPAEPGEEAPGFEGPMLSGGMAKMEELMGRRGLFVLFSRFDCPYTREALKTLPELTASWKAKGVNTVVVDFSGRPSAAETYGKLCPGVPVVSDVDGSICRKWGVDATPFFFLLDSDGAVVMRRSFTTAAGANAVAALLSLEGVVKSPPPTPRYNPESAG